MSPPPAELLLGEECYFPLYGFGLPGAYKLRQVLRELWRFLLEWLFAGAKEEAPRAAGRTQGYGFLLRVGGGPGK